MDKHRQRRGNGKGKKSKRKWTSREFPQPNYRNHSCPSSKVAYPSRSEAKRIARIMAQRGSDLLSPYDCPDCGAIHLGHSKRRGF